MVYGLELGIVDQFIGLCKVILVRTRIKRRKMVKLVAGRMKLGRLREQRFKDEY